MRSFIQISTFILLFAFLTGCGGGNGGTGAGASFSGRVLRDGGNLTSGVVFRLSTGEEALLDNGTDFTLTSNSPFRPEERFLVQGVSADELTGEDVPVEFEFELPIEMASFSIKEAELRVAAGESEAIVTSAVVDGVSEEFSGSNDAKEVTAEKETSAESQTETTPLPETVSKPEKKKPAKESPSLPAPPTQEAPSETPAETIPETSEETEQGQSPSEPEEEISPGEILTPVLFYVQIATSLNATTPVLDPNQEIPNTMVFRDGNGSTVVDLNLSELAVTLQEELFIGYVVKYYTSSELNGIRQDLDALALNGAVQGEGVFGSGSNSETIAAYAPQILNLGQPLPTEQAIYDQTNAAHNLTLEELIGNTNGDFQMGVYSLGLGFVTE